MRRLSPGPSWKSGPRVSESPTVLRTTAEAVRERVVAPSSAFNIAAHDRSPAPVSWQGIKCGADESAVETEHPGYKLQGLRPYVAQIQRTRRRGIPPHRLRAGTTTSPRGRQRSLTSCSA